MQTREARILAGTSRAPDDRYDAPDAASPDVLSIVAPRPLVQSVG